MNYIISGKNIDVTEGLRDAVYDKLGRLEKYFNEDTKVQVTFSVEKDRQKIKSDFLEEEDAADDEVKIYRSKRFAVKPMYPEDACVQMELLGHNFYVFRNAETDEVNVVYKRKGNTYGLIEPEF